ncbi:hypothetical protein PG988_000025 [Apiospora saccharicola]
MADQQEKQETWSRDLIRTVLANQRKRRAAKEGADFASKLDPRPNIMDPTDCRFLTGDHNRLQGRVDTVEQAVALIQRYKDLQPGGLFPDDTTIIISKPDPLAIVASNRPIEDQRAPARRNVDKAKNITVPTATSELKDYSGEPVLDYEA